MVEVLSHLVLSVNCVSLIQRSRHSRGVSETPMADSGAVDEPAFKVRGALEEGHALQEADPVSESNSDTQKSENQESIVTEELIVVTSYTLDSADSLKRRKWSRRPFPNDKFEEPLLQDIPEILSTEQYFPLEL